MADVAVAEPPTVTCSGCGDSVRQVAASDGRGSCCHDLPNPWHRGPEGLYNATSESEDPEGEDVVQDDVVHRARCIDCDSMMWRLTARQEVEADDEVENRIYYDFGDFGADITVRCANCGSRMPANYELEAY